jgi:hypothetical protein
MLPSGFPLIGKIIASMLKRMPAKPLVIAALILLAAALAAGFTIDANSYALHLLAELVGLLASVLVAVFIVDVLVERERDRRWELVAGETTSSLRFAILRTGYSIYLLLPAPRPPAADPYTMSEVPQTGLTSSLRGLAETVRDTQDIDLGKALIVLHDDLAVVRDSVMPRLLTIGRHELIAAVASLEGRLQQMEHTVWLDERFEGLPDGHHDLAMVIDAMTTVSELLDSTNGSRQTAGPAA